MASFHAKGKGNCVVKALEGVLGDDFEGPSFRDEVHQKLTLMFNITKLEVCFIQSDG